MTPVKGLLVPVRCASATCVHRGKCISVFWLKAYALTCCGIHVTSVRSVPHWDQKWHPISPAAYHPTHTLQFAGMASQEMELRGLNESADSSKLRSLS